MVVGQIDPEYQSIFRVAKDIWQEALQYKPITQRFLFRPFLNNLSGFAVVFRTTDCPILTQVYAFQKGTTISGCVGDVSYLGRLSRCPFHVQAFRNSNIMSSRHPTPFSPHLFSNPFLPPCPSEDKGTPLCKRGIIRLVL